MVPNHSRQFKLNQIVSEFNAGQAYIETFFVELKFCSILIFSFQGRSNSPVPIRQSRSLAPAECELADYFYTDAGGGVTKCDGLVPYEEWGKMWCRCPDMTTAVPGSLAPASPAGEILLT